MNYSKLTLGELLSSKNETIKRNAVSILKQLQREKENIWICSKCRTETIWSYENMASKGNPICQCGRDMVQKHLNITH